MFKTNKYSVPSFDYGKSNSLLVKSLDVKLDRSLPDKALWIKILFWYIYPDPDTILITQVSLGSYLFVSGEGSS